MLWLCSDAFKSRLSFLVVCGEVNVKLRRLQTSRPWYRHSAIYMSSPCPRQRLPLTPIRISKISVFDSLQITAAACNHSIHRQEVVPLFFFRLTVKCCQSYVRVTFHDNKWRWSNKLKTLFLSDMFQPCPVSFPLGTLQPRVLGWAPAGLCSIPGIQPFREQAMPAPAAQPEPQQPAEGAGHLRPVEDRPEQ